MKTQAKDKLQFTKQNIIELNDAEIYSINGGTDSISSIGVESMLSDILGTRDICNTLLAVMDNM